LGLVRDLPLFLAQLLRLLLRPGETIFHRAAAALIQEPLSPLDCVLRLLARLLLLRRITALRLLLHILRSLLQRARGIGHLPVVVFARKLIELAREAFGFLLQFLRGHLIAAARSATLLLLPSPALLKFLLAFRQFFQLA